MCAQPIPDKPVPFGYKQTWLAVRDAEPSSIAAALGLTGVKPSTWKHGIDRAYESGYDPIRKLWKSWVEIFVSPPVRGWILAVGGIGVTPSPESAEGLSWLRDLSASLGHVQHFGNHRVSSYAAWAKAERGEIIRAFAWADRTLINIGEQTPEEVELGFDFPDENCATRADLERHEAKLDAEYARMRSVRSEIEALEAEAKARGEELAESVYDEPRFQPRSALLRPEEDSVMMLAGRWSLDPTKLDEIEAEPGLGLLGMIQK